MFFQLADAERDMNPNNIFLSGLDGPNPIVKLGDMAQSKSCLAALWTRLILDKLAWKEIKRGILIVNLFRVVLLRYGKDLGFGTSLIYGHSVLR